MKIEYYTAGVFKTPLPWMMILAHPLIPSILVQKKQPLLGVALLSIE